MGVNLGRSLSRGTNPRRWDQHCGAAKGLADAGGIYISESYMSRLGTAALPYEYIGSGS